MKNLIIVRGSGEIATGTIHKLVSSGFPVLVLESAHPSVPDRIAAFSEAVYKGKVIIEGIPCQLAENPDQAKIIMSRGEAAMLIDEKASCLAQFTPLALVDATLTPQTSTTNMDMAPVTIALGPGFTACRDVDVVIETQCGNNLGRLIYSGHAAADLNDSAAITDNAPHAEECEKNFTISVRARCIAGGVLEAILQNLYLEKVSLK